MARFRVGNAPVSWGVEEIADWGPQLPSDRVLAEMAEAGYEGTELGPWGYLPDDRALLGEMLRKHGLGLASAFCPVNLHSEELEPTELANLRKEAALLSALGARDIIMADTGSPHRYQISGRVKAEAGDDRLSPDGWRRLRRHMETICEISAPLGLRVCYHPHVGTYVETDEEIDSFAEAVHGLPVGLCLDTGHLAYGGADPVEMFRTYASQVNFCHLKDYSQTVLKRCLAQRLDFTETTRAGVFVPLGRGDVDYTCIFDILRGVDYDGWLIVEQDRILTDADNPLEDARTSREFLRKLLGQ